MATATWAGGSSGNETDYGTAANWAVSGAPTRVPTYEDDVIIANVSDDCVLDGSRSVKSFVVQAGGDFNGNAETLTVVGKNGSDYAVDIDGDIVGTNTMITITTPDACDLDLKPTDGNVRDLTINHASCVATWTADTTLSRNLTITAGEFKAQGGATLEVTGATIVGDGSSGANTATLTCVSGAISLGASLTSGWGLEVKQGGTFVGGSGEHTIGSLLNADHADSIITLTSHANGTTLSSENAGVGSNGYALILYDDGVFDDANGLVVFTGPSSDSYVSGHNLHNVTINSSGNSIALQNGHTFAGNLTITAGTLTTRPAGTSENNALTVTGAIDCVGNLTCNSSAVQCNGLRSTGGTVNLPDGSGSFTVKGTEFSGYGIHDTSGSGNLVHNGGTVIWDIGGLSTMNAKSTFNNITTATSSTDLRWFNTLTLAGVLTVAANTDVYEHESAGGNLTVDGDVTVSGTLGNSSAYSAYEFGSLTIASGGTYNATSGTTTITSRTGGAGTYGLENNGTFTHNKGTVKITDADNNVSMKVGANLYNLELSGGYKKIRDNTTINNNLTLTSGDLYGHSGSLTLDVLGQTILNGGTTGQTIAFSGTMNWGNVTVNSGTLKLSSGTNNAESFRNVGGTIQ
jgi:hypothetical protein